MDFFTEIALYTLIGIVSGFFGGLLGIGGGLIMVPTLLLAFHSFDHAMHLAVGTSLAAMIFTSLASATTHYFRKGIRWQIFYAVTPGIIIGAIFGAWIASHLSSESLEFFFGGFAALFGVYFLFPKKGEEAKELKLLSSSLMIVPGICIGAVSALLGIGGGLIMVPLLTYFGVKIRNAISTSAATGVLIAIFGALSFYLFGIEEASADETLGFIYLPAFIAVGIASLVSAPLGAMTAHLLPVPMLQKIFGAFLILIGIKMM